MIVATIKKTGIFSAAILLAACDAVVSKDEVVKLASPDGRLVAHLYETNGGATTDFGYVITVSETSADRGYKVASLYGAGRSDCAYGVNLRWTGNDQLLAEYLDAKSAEFHNADINGKKIIVTPRTGVTDPNAPCGGMLYNQQRSKPSV
jgi:hypothetical protein